MTGSETVGQATSYTENSPMDHSPRTSLQGVDEQTSLVRRPEQNEINDEDELLMGFWESCTVTAKGFVGVGWMSLAFGFKEVIPSVTCPLKHSNPVDHPTNSPGSHTMATLTALLAHIW